MFPDYNADFSARTWNPFTAHVNPRAPSVEALSRVVKKADPNRVPYFQAERDAAKNAQAAEAQASERDFWRLKGQGLATGPSPAFSRDIAKAIGGSGANWPAFLDQMDLNSRMLDTRGFNQRIDTGGADPVHGIGRLKAQEGRIDPGGRVSTFGPSVDIQDLMRDAGAFGPSGLGRGKESASLRALERFTRGR